MGGMYRDHRDPYGHFRNKSDDPPICPNCKHDAHLPKERCAAFLGLPMGYCRCGPPLKTEAQRERKT